MTEVVRVTMVSAFLKLVLTKCGDCISKTDAAAGLKFAISGSLEPKLEELQSELTNLDALTSIAETLNPELNNRKGILSVWLKSVKEAAIFAENLLEDISYYKLRKQVESNKVAQLFSASDGTSIEFRHKIGRKLNKFKSMAADIYEKARKINPSLELVPNSSTSYQQPPFVTSNEKLSSIRKCANTSIVVGRQHDEDLIVEELRRTDIDDDSISVIALVGMSGVGKTTLAMKIFCNTVNTIYTRKTWVFVSHDFNLGRLLKEMLESQMEDSQISMVNTDAMENKLRACLQGERYLLVLDDVWNTDERFWDSIRSSLVRVTDGCTGSKVLVTTQSFEVASVMRAYLTHTIKVLSDDDAWTLFEGIAFANKGIQQVPELMYIGRRILKKAGGLPLSIRIFASRLAILDTKSEWESFERREVCNLYIMPWLLFAFNQLTKRMKQCFAHCSMIPKGGKFEEQMLIEWWIAQGFIRQSDTSDDSIMVDIGRAYIEDGLKSDTNDDSIMVDIGRAYIKCMLKNNLLQLIKRTGLLTMHDHLHDLALHVSMDSSLIIKGRNDLYLASLEVEHVLIHGGNTFNSLPNFPEGKTQSTLRTLICVNVTISTDLVAQARFLRQLHLIGCGLKSIPSSVGGLKHLRILTLNDNPIEYLPNSIGRLYNLQILRLQSCPRLVDLPQKVTKLLNLRIIDTTEAVHIPKGMGQLTRLTQLPVVKLKARKGRRLTELGSLLHLRGKVTIKHLENTSSKDVVYAGLKCKEGITELNLSWTSKGLEDNRDCCIDEEEVMEGLQPHSNLEVLQVESFHGKRFSTWLLDGQYCYNLKRLALLNCKGCERLPTLGCLPYLEFLSFDGMERVGAIGSDFYYISCDQRLAACSSTGNSQSNMSQSNFFPSLKKFELLNMPKLKEWVVPSGLYASAFSCLQELSIENCPFLVRVPSGFHSLKQLTVKGMNSGEPLLMILSSGYNLTSLTVENVHQLTSLSEPLLKCTSLQLLIIRGCKELVELPPTLQSMIFLRTLEIRECEKLASLPVVEGLRFLTTLDTRLCENIAGTPRGLERSVSIHY